YVPARRAERADGRGHRAHELVDSRAYEGAQTLPPRRIPSDRSDRRDARTAVAVRADVASEQGRGRSEGGADRSVHHGPPCGLTDSVDIELREHDREGGSTISRRRDPFPHRRDEHPIEIRL